MEENATGFEPVHLRAHQGALEELYAFPRAENPKVTLLKGRQGPTGRHAVKHLRDKPLREALTCEDHMPRAPIPVHVHDRVHRELLPACVANSTHDKSGARTIVENMKLCVHRKAGVSGHLLIVKLLHANMLSTTC